MPQMTEDKKQEVKELLNKSWRIGNMIVPEQVLAIFSPRERPYIRLGLKKLRTLIKTIAWILRNYPYTVRFGWDGVNPYIMIKLLFVEEEINREIKKRMLERVTKSMDKALR